MTTTPHVRLEDPAPDADRAADRITDGIHDCPCAALGLDPRGSSLSSGAPLQMVTPEQLDRAVLQLRERRGRPAAEQMQAVLRALELTVAPRIEHRR